MMTDREFLMWLHERITEVYGESSIIDFMHKFRDIITSIPENQKTRNSVALNSLDDLKEYFEKEECE